MKEKYKRTIKNIFAKPVQSGVPWEGIESLFVALDAEITKGNGSRVRIFLNGVRAVFHRHHPKKKRIKES